MAKISCIIVDDEPLALDMLEKYVLNTPFLHLLGRYTSAIDALEMLSESQVELVFLDIQMPDLNGIEFSRMIDKSSRVVFTTAFDHYAIEGFKVNALDYLLKPFNYPEFLAAAHKAMEWFELARNNIRETSDAYIFVRSEYKQIRVALEDVLYFEGLKDYVKICLKDQSKPVMTLMSLKALETELPPSGFMRVHRSFIVALDKIRAVERNQILIGAEARITVAEQYKAIFQDFMKGKSIGG